MKLELPWMELRMVRDVVRICVMYFTLSGLTTETERCNFNMYAWVEAYFCVH